MQAIHILQCTYSTVNNWLIIPRNRAFKAVCSPQAKAVQWAGAHTDVEARVCVCDLFNDAVNSWVDWKTSMRHYWNASDTDRLKYSDENLS